jgi:hypothetical protein
VDGQPWKQEILPLFEAGTIHSVEFVVG